MGRLKIDDPRGFGAVQIQVHDRVGYTIPLNTKGTSMELGGLFSKFHIDELRSLHLRGESLIGTLKATQAMMRTKTVGIDLFSYFDYKQIQNFVLGQRVSFDRLRVITGGALIDHYNSSQGRDYLNVRVAGGIPNFLGGLGCVSYESSRIGGGGRFVQLNLDYDRIQLVATSDWLAQAHIKKVHTFFVAVGDSDYIPVKANKFSREATLMHVVLGATNGSHKAPKYVDWAKEDPWGNPSQSRFIYPLEMLEIVRQPNYSAATILKGNAFESEFIDQQWRYGAEYACVEAKGQAKDTKKKINSAGLNACGLVEALSDSSDPIAEELDGCVPIYYENYTEEGYCDDLDISVSPGEVMKALQLAVERKREQELTRLVENLAIAKLGAPKTPILCEYIAGKLRANSRNG